MQDLRWFFESMIATLLSLIYINMVLEDVVREILCFCMQHCCLVGNCFSRLEVCLPPRALHLNIFDHEDSVCEKGIWIKGRMLINCD